MVTTGNRRRPVLVAAAVLALGLLALVLLVLRG
jgi:hypothetical protein